MKRVLLVLIAISLSVCFEVGANAAAPMRVEGRNCTVADRGADTWFGFFKGKREVFAPLKSADRPKDFTSWRCFEAEAECNSWTYWMQTDFPEGGNQAFCRQGG